MTKRVLSLRDPNITLDVVLKEVIEESRYTHELRLITVSLDSSRSLLINFANCPSQVK